MEVDHEEQYIVNGGLMKKYSGKLVRIYLNVANTSTGGRQVRIGFRKIVPASEICD